MTEAEHMVVAPAVPVRLGDQGSQAPFTVLT
jgi:hypothetical protein